MMLADFFRFRSKAKNQPVRISHRLKKVIA